MKAIRLCSHLFLLMCCHEKNKKQFFRFPIQTTITTAIGLSRCTTSAYAMVNVPFCAIWTGRSSMENDGHYQDKMAVANRHCYHSFVLIIRRAMPVISPYSTALVVLERRYGISNVTLAMFLLKCIVRTNATSLPSALLPVD